MPHAFWGIIEAGAHTHTNDLTVPNNVFRYELNEYLHLPDKLLHDYCAKLQCREHVDEHLRDLGVQQFKFVFNSASATTKTEESTKELTAATSKLSSKQVEAITSGVPLASSSSRSKSEVTILAHEAWTQLQAKVKDVQLEHKKVSAELATCSLLLAQLKAKGDPSSIQAHKDYLEQVAVCQKWLEEVLDFIAAAKIINPQDGEQAKLSLDQIMTQKYQLLKCLEQACS